MKKILLFYCFVLASWSALQGQKISFPAPELRVDTVKPLNADGVTFMQPTVFTNKIQIKGTRIPPTFYLHAVDSLGNTRFGLTKNGMLISGSHHDTQVNIDGLFLLGRRNALKGADSFVQGKGVVNMADTAGASGYYFTVPASRNNTYTVGYGSNRIEMSADSGRFVGKWNFGVTGPGSEVSSLLTMGPPDYALEETINRISTNGGTWTVDRDGYIRWLTSCHSTGTATRMLDMLFINGALRYLNGNVAPVGSQAVFTSGSVVPVKKGDVVKIQVGSNGSGEMTGMAFDDAYCYYIPPVLNPPVFLEEQPLLDYSTLEQDTGRRWINGKKVYQRTISVGNLPTMSAGAWINVPNTVGAFTGCQLIDVSVVTDTGNAVYYFLGNEIDTDGSLRILTPVAFTVVRTGTVITAKYTKM